MIVYVFPIETSTVSEAKSLNDLAQEAIDTDETIHINGYTDMSGSKAYNQKLSLERAKAVAEYLEKHGVPANHIVCQGMGPSCKYATPRQNRCVEAYIE